MTAASLGLVLSASTVLLALGGPWLLRQATPALVRLPRVAIAVVVGSVVTWFGAALAMGPVWAWAVSGPAVLPGPAADVCRRCLAAADPFASSSPGAAVPAGLLLGLPIVAAALLAVAVVGQMTRRLAASRHVARSALHDAGRRRVHGHDVSLLAADHPFAFALPARHGGIVVSTETLRVLRDDELTAVLAHEQAHVRQRHHLVASFMDALARPLHWVPLVCEAHRVLPHYLEIAADDSARRSAGTPAVVSALLKLGEVRRPALVGAEAALVLHAAGPERVRHLVQPRSGLSGATPAAAIVAYLAGLAALSTAVFTPYLLAVLSGCA